MKPNVALLYQRSPQILDITLSAGANTPVSPLPPTPQNKLSQFQVAQPSIPYPTEPLPPHLITYIQTISALLHHQQHAKYTTAQLAAALQPRQQ